MKTISEVNLFLQDSIVRHMTSVHDFFLVWYFCIKDHIKNGEWKEAIKKAGILQQAIQKCLDEEAQRSAGGYSFPLELPHNA